MNLKRWLAATLLCATATAWDAPKGTVPRSAPDKYSAHAESQGIAIGARLLTASQARKAFATDVDRCCMVVEVAFYPKKNSVAEVSRSDFALRIVGQDIATPPSTPDVVAGKLQQWIEQQQPKANDVAVSQNDTIGHSSGRDPNTGRRTSGTYESTGASVSVGLGGPSQPAPPMDNTGRRFMEQLLNDKGLPQGSTATPVSGYLYFAHARKNAKYQLEYVLNGNKVVLALP
jgi:hypothetical protein